MRGLAVVLAVLLASCSSSGPAPSATEPSRSTPVTVPAATALPASAADCGVSDLRPSAEYDAAGLECFWKAYSAGQPVRWSVVRYTTEGAPTPATMTFTSGVLVVTRDMSKDGFSSQADRRVWTWRCAALQQRTWVTNPQRYSFELRNCTGDGPTAIFP